MCLAWVVFILYCIRLSPVGWWGISSRWLEQSHVPEDWLWVISDLVSQHVTDENVCSERSGRVAIFFFLIVGKIRTSACHILTDNMPVLFLIEIDLKEAQRFFAQKFSCGASATAEDEIIIQGDFTDDIIDVIQEKWPEVKYTNEMFLRRWKACVDRDSGPKTVTWV